MREHQSKCKQELRAILSEDIALFLARGGSIKEVPVNVRAQPEYSAHSSPKGATRLPELEED